MDYDLTNNTRAIALDLLPSGEVNCYVGVARVGIYVVPFDLAGGFDTTRELEVETPGEVYGLALRRTGSDRVLLVTDGSAGFRLLGPR